MSLIIILMIAVQILICGFAIGCGDRVLRMAGVWITSNILLHALVSFGGVASPTLHLLSDGIYATGLLPLAFLSVSPWIGALALLACGSFILQSVYLLSDKPTDLTFVLFNNLIVATGLLTLAAGTATSVWNRRRQRRAQLPTAAAAAA